MLKRKAYERLLRWKNAENRKALCVLGAADGAGKNAGLIR